MQSFLQSKSWEKFQQSVGFKTFRVDGALLIKKPLKFGKSYLYAPRITHNAQRITQFFDAVQELAKREKCIFLRIEPQKQLEIKNYELRKVNDIQPSQTIVLDLSQSEEQLLKDMHSKTRYNIRLAEKKGVEIKESNDIGEFWSLMEETTGRDGFRAHSKKHYAEMLRLNCHSKERSDEESNLDPSAPLRSVQDDRKKSKMSVRLYFAEYENKILAAGIFVFYPHTLSNDLKFEDEYNNKGVGVNGDTVTYLHGASTQEHKEVMAPYALHWQMIKIAKQLGYKYYDFYGINEKKWPGVTRFKRGFGGKEVNYPGCYDVVFNNIWYRFYNLVRGLKKLV